MTQNQIDISELLCSRLCHDIVAPIGAINSGLELLKETTSNDKDEIIDLIYKSAENAAKKLTLFRFAYGASSTKQIANLDEIKSLLGQIIDPDKFKLQINFSTPIDIPQDQMVKWGKLILQTTMTVADAAPYGGQLTVSSDNRSIKIHLNSDKVIDNQTNFDIMKNGCAQTELTPRNISHYLIHNIIKNVGGDISKESTEKDLTYTLQVSKPG